MPLYVYETIPQNGEEPEHFEIEQPITDEALTHHPVTGVPVRRVLFAPHIARSEANVLSDKNIAEKGFTKYANVGNGRYEKIAGSGPDSIQR